MKVIYKSISKGCVPNWSEKVFVIKRMKDNVPWTYFIIDPKGEESVGRF